MAKQIAFRQEAREKILSGIAQLSRAVRVTHGPRGRNVVLAKSWGSPTVTKDGVTVAKEIELPDPFENMGAQMVKEVGLENERCGRRRHDHCHGAGRVHLHPGPESGYVRIQTDGDQARHRAGSGDHRGVPRGAQQES